MNLVKCNQMLIFLIFIHTSQAKNPVQFIKGFIDNEKKSTILILNHVCWAKRDKLELIKTLTIYGIRVSFNVYNSTTVQDHMLLFLVDLDCPGAEASLKQVFPYLRYPFRWLALTKKSDKDIQYIWELPLYVDSDFVLAKQIENRLYLTELHKPSTSGPTYSSPRGFYNGSLFDTRQYRELFRRRKDIMGHALTMSNVIQDSNTTKYHLPREDRLERHFDAIAKVSWTNVHLSFQMLNATPRYIFSYRWGYKKNGQWSGMINDLNTGKADLGTNCVASVERLSVAVFTDSIAKYKVKFIFRQPPLSYISNIFVLPFSRNVWIAIGFSLIVSTITIFLTTNWEAKTFKTGSTQLDGSICDAMLLTMSAVSQQGCSKEPKKYSGRIMVFIIFSALMALYAAYSANIVVLLQAPSSAIKTLDQLAFSNMKLAALDVDYNYFVLKIQKDPIRMAIYKKVEPDKGKGNFYNLNEGIELLRRGLFAFHSIVEPMYLRIEETFLENEKCDLMEVDFLNALDPFVPVYKHSPYLELLRVVFKRIRESGIQMANEKRLKVFKPRCTEKMSTFSSVGLVNVEPVLLFMLYGFLVSFLIMCAEIVVHRITYFYNKLLKT